MPKGKCKHSKKTIEKTIEGRRRNHKEWFTKKAKENISNALTGRKLSEEHREKIKQGMIKVYDEKGRKTNLHRLLRNQSIWKIWREAIFLRDNFTCQNPNCKFCNNEIGVLLHPHHKKSFAEYPELRFDVSNGITYCAEFHIKGGLHVNIQKIQGGKINDT